MNSTIPPLAHSMPKLHPTPIIPFMSDKQLSLLLPLVVYWLYAGFFHLVSIYKVPIFEKYRIHTLYEAETKNKVSLGEVVRGVLLQQFLQTLLGLFVVLAEDEDVLLDDTFEMKQYGLTLTSWGKSFAMEKFANDYQHMIVPVLYWYLMPVLRFFVAMLFIDTWQYFMHRLFHQNAFLYRHIHSRHHRLYAPYAFGALYNHPLEGFVMDSVGVSLGFKLSGMSTRGAMVLFFFATLKTVDDHCGYDLPFNPIQRIFGNNAAYHDIHHQSYGIKSNFSQPFFTIWDRICGTYMPHPPSPKGSLQNGETAKIRELSLKSNGVSDDKDDTRLKGKERSAVTESSHIKYNLRPRKAISSL